MREGAAQAHSGSSNQAPTGKRTLDTVQTNTDTQARTQMHEGTGTLPVGWVHAGSTTGGRWEGREGSKDKGNESRTQQQHKQHHNRGLTTVTRCHERCASERRPERRHGELRWTQFEVWTSTSALLGRRATEAWRRLTWEWQRRQQRYQDPQWARGVRLEAGADV